MNFCTQCGHELGVGRFCTNCGHPVTEMAAAEQTAVRPAVDPQGASATPPPASSGTTESRFPLFADEVDPETPSVTAEQPAVAPVSPPPPVVHHSHRRRSMVPWLLGAAILVVLALIVGGILVARDDATTTAPRTPGDSAKPPPSPDSSHSQSTGGVPSGEPSDIARYLQVSAPRPAPPNQDVNGNMVRYVPENMTDGVAETCWRTPGDATGDTLTFTLPEAAVITQVGLINGYAKIATDSSGTYDWYRGNRRILVAEWTFDDGTTIRQRFTDSTDVQAVPVDQVRTRAISLRLLRVSPPGRGPSSRNYTAISDVSVTGAAAG